MEKMLYGPPVSTTQKLCFELVLTNLTNNSMWIDNFRVEEECVFVCVCMMFTETDSESLLEQ